MNFYLFLYFLGLSFLSCQGASSLSKTNPNVILILTDDQDLILGGMSQMSKVKSLLQDKGMTFTNMFTPTPICCPSRSSILTGRYSHNHRTVNNSLSGNCSSSSWVEGPEKLAFPVSVKKAGYRTFFAGKYLNQYGTKAAGGPEHVPPGWDKWLGLVGNSRYYNYTVSDDGKPVKHMDVYAADYFTDLIANRSVDFINQQKSVFVDTPFMMMVSTPAPHSPWDSAPQYADRFSKNTAPRDGCWDHNGKGKHWLIRQATNPMLNSSIAYLDNAFRKRWQTLLSVDDLVARLVNAVDEIGELDNTYFLYTSDNGYHLGQFSLPIDKRQLYEFDIRVPFIIRGPGVSPNVTRSEPVVNIDIAPTIVDIVSGGTGEIPDYMDGMSMVPLFKGGSKPKWRRDFVVEYNGEGEPYPPPGCPGKSAGVSQCFPDCVCEDAYNNTYSCIRTLDVSTHDDLMYCEFTDSESFVELYNHSTDPFQLTNIKPSVNPQILVQMNQRLIELGGCAGKSCRTANYPKLKFVPGTKSSDSWFNNIYNSLKSLL